MKRTNAKYLIAASIMCIPLIVLAQSEYSPPISAKSIQEILGVLIDLAKKLILPLSGIAIMIGGFMYVASGGSEERIKTAHRAITYGILGLVIVLGSDLVLGLVYGLSPKLSPELYRGETIEQFFSRLGTFMGTVIMGVSVLFILYSGFLFTTGGGSQEKVETARRVLTYAIVGVAVALLAFAVPGLIKQVVQP